jgi:hypothetical protein
MSWNSNGRFWSALRRSLKLRSEVFPPGAGVLGRAEKSADHKDISMHQERRLWRAAYQAGNVREGGKEELPDFAQI